MQEEKALKYWALELKEKHIFYALLKKKIKVLQDFKKKKSKMKMLNKKVK